MSQTNEMTAVFSAVAQLPNTLNTISTGIQTVKAASHVPAAVSGAMPSVAAAAIVGLGVEMVIFFFKAAEAVWKDIEGVKKAIENLEETESETSTNLQNGADSFSQFDWNGQAALCTGTGTYAGVGTYSGQYGTESFGDTSGASFDYRNYGDPNQYLSNSNSGGGSSGGSRINGTAAARLQVK